MNRRVVITGMGAITPIGNTVEEFWNNSKEGVCGIDNITLFDTTDYKVKIAGEVKNFKAEDYIDRKEVKRLDRFTHFAFKAADEAMKDANLNLKDENIIAEKVGVIVGSGIGGYQTIETEVEKLINKGPNRVSPFSVPSSIINLVAGNLAIRYGAKGICESLVTACATGNTCIGTAFRNIKHGYADIIIAGGAEAVITRAGVAGFTNLKALNTSNDPKRSSIPFDKERSGFVMGEGAGILILESLESAEKRGAKIYAEIVGYGATCDAYHITSPDPEGEGAKRSMEAAIEESKINKEEISYINAHGTSTPYNDKFETIAIKKCFGETAYKIPVSSTKSMTGHLLGAAGAIEAIVCVKALGDNFIPPTIGYKEKDEECDLDYVPNKGRCSELNYVLSNSLGFGGHNVSLLFKKWK
ncbi:beta-ketoacyl-ACP synthase II [Clostridium tarantellae]|uniref:3-oxoacyl-[acyl-carrier-protein] synthase 2 n=1 Tax=Clostridium tarantellae TaxID=39493 RepID=A0A6I1MLK7_9CLOT|nr:beta-ketoacyl-ACP synthase II [Clostridium tarantellae]MPQ43900.1 beta-ketoacyl-ACP synthase II [Clostridium tarantellae]